MKIINCFKNQEHKDQLNGRHLKIFRINHRADGRILTICYRLLSLRRQQTKMEANLSRERKKT